MNYSIVYICILLIGVVSVQVYGGCEDDKNEQDDEIKSFFKNIGCKIQEGAKDLQKSSEPWVSKIGASAKELGSNVAQKYGDLKHKLIDNSSTVVEAAAPFAYDASTEKVPLAVLNGESGSTNTGGAPAHP